MSSDRDYTEKKHPQKDLESVLHGLAYELNDEHGGLDGCPFVVDQLHAAIEGELDNSTASFVASHVKKCASCRREKDRLERERLELLESFVSAPVLPERFAQKVVATLREKEAGRQQRARLLRRRFVVGLAAGLVLGAAIFGMALQTTLFSGGSSPTDGVADHSALSDSSDSSPREVVLPVEEPTRSGLAIPVRGSAAERRVSLPVVRETVPPTTRTIEMPVVFHGDRAVGRLTLRAVTDALGGPPCDVDFNLDGSADEIDLVHMITAQTNSSPVLAELVAYFDCHDC